MDSWIVLACDPPIKMVYVVGAGKSEKEALDAVTDPMYKELPHKAFQATLGIELALVGWFFGLGLTSEETAQMVQGFADKILKMLGNKPK